MSYDAFSDFPDPDPAASACGLDGRPPLACSWRYAGNVALDGCGAVCHFAVFSSSAIARLARWVLGAATPTKSPSRTTTAPSIAFAGPKSISVSFAPYDGARSTLP